MPTVDAVNAIGAGDVCTGVFAHHLGKGDEPVDAFAWGLAAACARVTRQLPGFEAAKVRESRRLGLASPHPSTSLALALTLALTLTRCASCGSRWSSRSWSTDGALRWSSEAVSSTKRP